MRYGKILDVQLKNDTLEVRYEYQTCYVQQMQEGIIRFTTNPNYESYAVVLEPQKIVWNVKKENDSVIVEQNDLKIVIENEFKIQIYDKGQLVCADYMQSRNIQTEMTEEQLHMLQLEGHVKEDDSNIEGAVEIVKCLGKNDAIYGLGDKPGCLNKRGYSFVNWNTDDPAPHVDSFPSLYKSIPFFMVLQNNYCYGILADNTYKTTFDFGKENADYYYIKHDGGALDYYFIAGPSMKEVVGRYVDLTGHAKLPQKWLFGYHQSRWSYFSENEIRQLASDFNKYDIPCDCIHLDIDYMDGYRVFTFDKKRFPHPEVLTKDLKKQGIRLISIVDPGVKKDENYEVYQEGMDKDAFAHAASGEVYENVVWPGDSVYPDFTSESVRTWWGTQIKKMLDVGISGIWNDMNEPASFRGPLPDDVVFEKGQHKEIHNVYGHLMAQATYDGLKKYDPEHRPFVLTRACYAGSQRYCGGWTGDNHSIWSHIFLSLEQMQSLGISGIMMSGSDLGGFGSDTTPELMVRFFEAAIFSPFFRSHSAMGTKRQEPWMFDEKTVGMLRKIIALRYRFLPYIYDLAYECEQTGAPILRPLVFEYQDDEQVYNLGDEYLLGANVLVAPIIEPGKSAREVYLPNGTWFDFATGQSYEGGKHILAHAALDELPIFVKAGTILPLLDSKVHCTDEWKEEDVVLHLYEGCGSYVHYCDDGESPAYENGAYAKVLYEQKEHFDLTETVLHDGYAHYKLKTVRVEA